MAPFLGFRVDAAGLMLGNLVDSRGDSLEEAVAAMASRREVARARPMVLAKCLAYSRQQHNFLGTTISIALEQELLLAQLVIGAMHKRMVCAHSPGFDRGRSRCAATHGSRSDHSKLFQ